MQLQSHSILTILQKIKYFLITLVTSNVALWKAYLIGLGIFTIFGAIMVFVFPLSSEIAEFPMYYLGTIVGEYFLYGSMAFVIYWGVSRFIDNKGLAIIIALIPVIILRFVVSAGAMLPTLLRP